MLTSPDLAFLKGLRCAVTGGTGFVGQHLVQALVDAGAEVTCLVRSHERARCLPAQARHIVADLISGQGLDAFVRDQDVCVHLAAVLFGVHWQDYLRGNACAAENLGAALSQHGQSTRRIVLVSSLAATGPCAVAPGVADDTQAAPVSAYGWSKLMAEHTLARHVGERMVTLRPPIIYGSKDRGLLPYFKAARWGLVVVPGLGRRFPVSLIHVQDIVHAVARCCVPQARGIYHCNDGAEHDMRDMGRAIATAWGRTPRVISVPLPLMGATAVCSSVVGQAFVRLGKRAPSLTVDKYREAKQPGWLCAGTRIREELGFTPTVSLTDGVAEALTGYKRAGWL